jgi:hypothetical protein
MRQQALVCSVWCLKRGWLRAHEGEANELQTPLEGGERK